MPRLTIAIALILALASPSLAGDLKIGHFNLQKIIAQSQAGKDAAAKYLKKAQTFKEQIKESTDKLNAMRAEVKKLSGTLKKGEAETPDLVAREEDVARQYREVQRMSTGAQDELKVYDKSLTRQVIEQFRPVLAGFAEKNKYDYLFQVNGGLAYASNRGDMTDLLIQAFDSAYTKK